MSRMRIDKFLSEMQIVSRSECKKMVKKGRIRVGEVVVKDAGQKMDPLTDTVYVDGKPVQYEKYQYFMLYKPAGCITATEDASQRTVMEYLPKDRRRGLAPVGRLDKDTEGLLLITDDGVLNHNLLAPGKHVDKTYYARIEGRVTQKEQEAFRAGLEIGEKKPTAPAVLEILSSSEESEIRVTITEGKFHQIKRMFGAVGMKVLYLKRLSMGTLLLDPDLKPGQWRPLTEQEITQLKEERNVK
ncbi:MAG: pseudouridine synthase [Eubacterium sp.]